MQKISKTLLLTASLLLSPMASAVVIDFEDQVGGTITNSQYAGLGVIFSSPPSSLTPTIGDFSSNSTTGNVLQDFSRVPLSAGEPFQIIADFVSAVMSVSVTAYASTSLGLVMSAYDDMDMLLGSVTSTPTGSNFNQGTISLSGIGPISRVIWMTTDPTFGSPGIDNLTFNEVPAPSTAMLLAAGLIGFRATRRNRRA